MDREGGFIILHRRIRSWPLWYFMSAEQRMVWVQILLDANWKDSEAWHGTTRFIVQRGQLIHSENTLARRAGVGRKVVRTALEKLAAEGAITRSRIGQVQIANGTETGPAEGQGPHIITIVNYGKYQDVAEEKGPREGQGRAKRGPSEGQAGALSEQVEPVEQGEPTTIPVAADAAPRRRKAKPASPADPRYVPFLEAADGLYRERTRGEPLAIEARDGKRLRELLSRHPTLSVEQWSRVYRHALALGTKYPGGCRIHQIADRWSELVLSMKPGPVASVASVTAPASNPDIFKKLGGGPVHDF